MIPEIWYYSFQYPLTISLYEISGEFHIHFKVISYLSEKFNLFQKIT